MHPILQLLLLWLFAFVTLCGALLLFNIYSDVIGYDFTLHSLRKELFLAGLGSFIEGASVWAVVTYFPAAGRALFLPVLLVGIIYAATHIEDWNRMDAGYALMFQFALGGILGCLFTGHFSAALIIATGFGLVLAVVASITKGL